MFEKHFIQVSDLRFRLPRQHLPRTPLLERLNAGLAMHQIILIHAPAGYGKTVLLAECIEQELRPTVYFRFERSPCNSEALLLRLVHWIGTLNPASAQRVEYIIEQTKALDIAYRELAQVLEFDIGPALIVLDDYHVADCPQVNQNLEILIDHLPLKCSIILSSRGQPDLPLARWSAEGRLAIFSECALRFSEEETVALVSSLLQRELSLTEIELLKRDYAGWVMGLMLGASALRTRPQADFWRFLEHEHGHTRTIDDFFAREVIRNQLLTPAEHDFVYRTSILDDLVIDVCNDLLGIQNAGDLLRSLERRDIFITRLDEAGMVYAYHPAFRVFLQGELLRASGSSTVQALHLNAAEIYERSGTWDRAIPHYFLAGAYEHAAQLIQTRGHELLDRPGTVTRLSYLYSTNHHRSPDTLLDWLDTFPTKTIETSPELLLLKGRVLLYRADYHKARPLFEQALERFRAEGDAVNEAWTAAHLATVAHTEEQHVPAIALLKSVLPQAETNPIVKAETLLSLSINLGAMGQMPGAFEAGETALEVGATLPQHHTRLGLEMRISRNLAHLCLQAGHLDRATSLAERACSISRYEKIGGIYAHVQNLATQMQVQVASGDFEAAKLLGASWERISQHASFDPHNLARLASLRGAISLAEQDYAQAEAYFKQAGNRPVDLIHLRLLQGNLPEALHLAEQEYAAHEPSQQPLLHSIAQAWIGIIENQAGNIGRGRTLLKNAIQFFEEHELRYWQIGAELHLCWFLSRLGQRQLSHQILGSAFGYAARLNAMNFAFWHPMVTAIACAEALAAKIQPDYVVELASRQLKLGQAHCFQPLLRHARSGTRECAEKILTALGYFSQAESSQRVKRQRGLVRLGRAVESLIMHSQITDDGAIKLAQTYRLTPREIEVFVWYINPNIRGAQRRINAAIAAQLTLSESTVRDYVSIILKKLNAPARDRLQLRAWAVTEGIIPS